MHQQLIQWVDDDIEVVQAENSLSNRAFLRSAILLGLLAFVHGFGVFSSEDGGGNEK
jgi:hypothetical protein